jgi:hypothetical protein
MLCICCLVSLQRLIHCLELAGQARGELFIAAQLLRTLALDAMPPEGVVVLMQPTNKDLAAAVQEARVAAGSAARAGLWSAAAAKSQAGRLISSSAAAAEGDTGLSAKAPMGQQQLGRSDYSLVASALAHIRIVSKTGSSKQQIASNMQPPGATGDSGPTTCSWECSAAAAGVVPAAYTDAGAASSDGPAASVATDAQIAAAAVLPGPPAVVADAPKAAEAAAAAAAVDADGLGNLQHPGMLPVVRGDWGSVPNTTISKQPYETEGLPVPGGQVPTDVVWGVQCRGVYNSHLAEVQLFMVKQGSCEGYTFLGSAEAQLYALDPVYAARRVQALQQLLGSAGKAVPAGLLADIKQMLSDCY